MSIVPLLVTAALTVVAAKPSAQTSGEAVRSVCETRDSTVIEALQSRGEHRVARLSAQCKVEGGLLDGATLTLSQVYSIRNGLGTLVAGLADHRKKEATARAESMQGSISGDGEGGWSAQWQDFFKTATGSAQSLGGTVINWRVRFDGSRRFVMTAHGASSPR